MWILSVELIVALSTSDFSSTKGTLKNSSELFAVSAFVLKIVNSVLAELSNTSIETVGVLLVLFVTLMDFIIMKLYYIIIFIMVQIIILLKKIGLLSIMLILDLI